MTIQVRIRPEPLQAPESIERPDPSLRNQGGVHEVPFPLRAFASEQDLGPEAQLAGRNVGAALDVLAQLAAKDMVGDLDPIRFRTPDLPMVMSLFNRAAIQSGVQYAVADRSDGIGTTTLSLEARGTEAQIQAFVKTINANLPKGEPGQPAPAAIANQIRFDPEVGLEANLKNVSGLEIWDPRSSEVIARSTFGQTGFSKFDTDAPWRGNVQVHSISAAQIAQLSSYEGVTSPLPVLIVRGADGQDQAFKFQVKNNDRRRSLGDVSGTFVPVPVPRAE